MQARAGLLHHFGKALAGALGDSAVNGNLVEVLPEVVQEAWDSWSKSADLDERHDQIEQLAAAEEAEIRQLVAAIVKDLGAPTEEVRVSLTAYLSQIPPTIRHSLRRPADPSGLTVPGHLPLEQSRDLLPFLPVRLARFHAGDAPLPGVDWELVELLGVGGFGEVWKAKNPNMSSAQGVALKFCLDPFSAKVLRNEAKLLDRLLLQGKHPGIVGLRQTYLSADPPCLEYDFIAGGDLAGVIREASWHHNKLNAAHIARFMLRLAKIVAFAHRLDPPIVHRDLKPANILVQRGSTGKLDLRIADFGNGGVAASQAIRQTVRGASQAQYLISSARGAYTPLYLSPQQMRGQDADPRDDVYALGIIWYQFLTGDLSSGRPGGTRWTKRLAEQDMASSLIDLLASCIEDNPDDRPHNAGTLADQLSVLLKEEPEAAPAAVAESREETKLSRRVANSVQMTLSLIPAGTFRMGSPPNEPERGDDEGPQHEITILRPFYMSIYPVTQRQYEGVMGANPSYFNEAKGGGMYFPVERVSWDEAVEFCRRLSERPEEAAAGRVYRLPTEAEWEYACRAGLPTPFSFGFVISSREANFNGNYPYGLAPKGPYLERTSKVGSYSPNPFGLYDMAGNVWEWCADYYDRAYYRASPRFDPPGPQAGSIRVVRGGSCFNIGRFCRAAYRFGVRPTNRDIDVGFRVVMTLAGGEEKEHQ
jgi:formylglycine-generating enzyme required for sulfatase activity